jgi:hypothetical protein
MDIMTDFYGKRGCCLTCEDKETMEGYQEDVEYEEKNYDCICFECRCSICNWYSHGECTYPRTHWLSWEDYEEQAQKEQKDARQRFGSEPTNLRATFSNGSLTAEIFYCNAVDVPHRIIHYLKEGYPHHYRTLLLKKVERFSFRESAEGEVEKHG